ncbi:hypothetical protein [Deinococcus sp. QL22]|uniref:hypothetical protein n=1 Tax=Deinococcus sp. QL22 TaxID=2939437 RepID=UPI00201721EA|nr:hypothetical protein [Deinococcus sp. QL22]UQN10284.1 hypothetical protein M1R55_29475 [Deinococcus sp. QL22]UQN10418.1 hypothetical protein M1R55_28800 [Deinococcus sp. QL22]
MTQQKRGEAAWIAVQVVVQRLVEKELMTQEEATELLRSALKQSEKMPDETIRRLTRSLS